ncbi:hypothetical protein DRN98_09295 [Methanosarcinales archaeon]|nr:MAG: hypothetical protein DRN98_09295 [Methanosarcinales archaeon]
MFLICLLSYASKYTSIFAGYQWFFSYNIKQKGPETITDFKALYIDSDLIKLLFGGGRGIRTPVT